MSIFRFIIKLLTFRLHPSDLEKMSSTHFLMGLLGTWIVGMGRYWDDPRASLLQHLGIGSVIYIFVLAAFIWLLLKPYFLQPWKYKTVLTFISLTSFPALFYAIPVERFMSISNANTVNVWFLAVVALWRVCLLFYFFKMYCNLKIIQSVVVTLMPICLIIASLTALNLHHVVFNIMGGVRNPTPHDSAYTVLIMLTVFSIALAPILIILYLVEIYKRYRIRKHLNENNLP